VRIHTRIFAGFLIVLSIGFSALLYWIADDLEPQFRKATEEPLVDTSRFLASLAATTARDGHIDAALFREAFEDTYSRPFTARIYDFLKTGVDYRIYITDAIGVVIYDSRDGMDEGRDYSRWNDVRLTLNGRYGARTTQEDPGDPLSSVMYVAAPVVADGRTIGVLSVGKPVSSVNRFTEDAKRKFVLGGLVIGASAVLIGILLSWRITAPIKRLTAYARAVRDGRKTELPRLGSGETRELGEAFDEMRCALDGKQYVEDYIQTLTHEIKSPLSAIRGATELLAEKDVPPDQQHRFLTNIRDESERISLVVEKLLLLSSLEKLNHVYELKAINMAEMVSGIKESLYPVLQSKGLTLEATGEKDCVMEGDPFLIRQAVANLIQNAIDFSPEGGVITAEILNKGGYVVLSVRDRGSGIPQYAVGRIFERFYSLKRPDSGKKGSGLGLCLVREVAALHKGTVELMNSPAGGVTATLSLPREPY